MEKLKVEGRCVYCDTLLSSRGISKHLSTHLKEAETAEASSKQAFHIKVSAAEMFLHLLMDGAAKFGDLDSLLRGIWLECCGHMSSFQVKGKDYDFSGDDFGEPMSAKISTAFKKGVKLKYEYDFGSTTQLEIQVVNEYKLAVPKKILLLSRNEPLPILCHVCKEKPAKAICAVCLYEGPSFFCASCTKKHEKSCSDFEDYARMPVVNSPRMGVCGYEGGSIDKKRDGIWTGV